ncbi:hypothetical protein [Tianweitania sediminis]|uniref:Uncharacterized protein n=1 Tax=Tianweitania sediminis TaxID=1502156 RepID=A0A8J7RJP8_9HYPH|nr:hypothetical protein [Tianweitania sediminis]MBP0438516.1 hypothetical protein [Tianweitania sediminis]
MSVSKDLSLRAPAFSSSHAVATRSAAFETSVGDLGYVLHFASKIIVAIPRPQAWIETITLQDPLGFQAGLQDWTSLDYAMNSDETSSSDLKLTIASTPRDAGLDLTGRVAVTIETEDGGQIAFNTRIATVKPGAHGDPVLRGLVVAAAEAGAIDLRASSLLGNRCRWVAVEEFTPLLFNSSLEGEDGVLIEGWMQDAHIRSFALVNTDFTSYVHVEDMLLRAVERPAEVRNRTRRRSQLTKLEGFLAALPLNGCSAEEVLVVEHLAGETLLSGPYRLKLEGNPQHMVEEVTRSIELDPDQPLPKSLAVVSALTRRRSIAPSFRVQRFGQQSEAKISIVVAMSGDEIFLQSLLHQQQRLSPHLEWVICLEAGERATGFARIIATQGHRLRGAIKLVIADSPCGTMRLKNIGAEKAAGDILVFVEETTWFEDRRPWLAALLALRDRAFDVVGVGLAMEDGNLDNEGLFVRNHALSPHLPSVEFKNRGRPSFPSRPRPVIEPVDAVSSAALVTSRGRFFAIGGFDEGFEAARYADNEFARRAAAAGAMIGFVSGRGATHVEGAASAAADQARLLADRLRHAIALADQTAIQGLLT